MAAFPDCTFEVQEQQLGTAHAAACAAPRLEGYTGDVLVCYGDMPMISRRTYSDLVTHHTQSGNDCTMLTGNVENPHGYGRIKRDADGGFSCIVEERDCTDEERKIREINVGIYVFNAAKMLDAISRLSNNNAQSEYYLTDAPLIIAQDGGKVGIVNRELGNELLGVSTVEDLARIDAILRG